MKPATRDRLLALNRQFYADVAEPFHSTRRSWPQGNVRLLDSVPPAASERPVRVLDAGCGNGRFAAVLNSLGNRVRYTGVDANARLLELATDSTAGLAHVEAAFVQADLHRSRMDRGNWVIQPLLRHGRLPLHAAAHAGQ